MKEQGKYNAESWRAAFRRAMEIAAQNDDEPVVLHIEDEDMLAAWVIHYRVRWEVARKGYVGRYFVRDIGSETEGREVTGLDPEEVLKALSQAWAGFDEATEEYLGGTGFIPLCIVWGKKDLCRWLDYHIGFDDLLLHYHPAAVRPMIDEVEYHRALRQGREDAAEMVRAYVRQDAEIDFEEMYAWIDITRNNLPSTAKYGWAEGCAAGAAEILEYWRMIHDPQYLDEIVARYELERGEDQMD